MRMNECGGVTSLLYEQLKQFCTFSEIADRVWEQRRTQDVKQWYLWGVKQRHPAVRIYAAQSR